MTVVSETQSVAADPDTSEATLHPDRETIVVLDFGSQYSRLICRRVREARVYAELLPWNASAETIRALRPIGVILSGGPASVYEEDAPTVSQQVFELGVPVLGICYGMQLLAHQLGGKVAAAPRREYGAATIHVDGEGGPLFQGLPADLPVWMSHGDHVEELPPGFRVLARSANSPAAAMADSRGRVGLQFHPEVVHTPQGQQLIENFCYGLCGATGGWTAGSFIAEATEQIRQRVGTGRVICGLSGGVDSAVTAALVHQAIGEQLTCIFVDNGLLRKNEAANVVETFERHLGFELVVANAADEFLRHLHGVTDPESKRLIIGERFVRVFERVAGNLGTVEFLAQGTLYPDVIESAGGTESEAAARIKTHHNVGGLPPNLQFQLIEPLRYLFKDEGRAVGTELGLPEELVWRHPFPGPGLAVRIISDVTSERLATLQDADAIFIEEIRAAGWYRRLGQAFAVLTPLQSTGVMGDFRTYGHLVALRAILTSDYMTADWAPLPHDLLGRIATRIVNEVPGVNRVVYDITSKPPATVEWE
ncbi:MAG: glutamine-hydrolyzing GMP synthase [Dehalococcoidia bacterium]|nr:glutamine-hydrolyzing GMP synthase [Dehalococcoidia bacterium]